MSRTAVVIGGGFFGAMIALHLRTRGFGHVIVCEREGRLLARASYANQARVHNGYHYPRSYLTALRSHANYARFIEEFGGCVRHDYVNLYAISRQFSNVSAAQFRRAMDRIGAPLAPLPQEYRALFSAFRIAEAFLTIETVFDATKLRDMLVERLARAGATLQTGTTVERLAPAAGEVITATVVTPNGASDTQARHVFTCAYAGINDVLCRSSLPPIALKHELAEMALVEMPPPLAGVGITVMCGPFFSCLPFPPRGLHTLTHVRYTPRASWYSGLSGFSGLSGEVDAGELPTAFAHMRRDAARYVPALNDAIYRGSLFEVKTLLPRNEVDDGRPILFRRDHGMVGHHVIMGGKIDNVYDMETEIDRMLA